MKMFITPVIFYLNKMAVIYFNNVAVIYADKIANLLELENQQGVQFSRPEIFKRLGGIIREVINWLIRSGANGEP